LLFSLNMGGKVKEKAFENRRGPLFFEKEKKEEEKVGIKIFHPYRPLGRNLIFSVHFTTEGEKTKRENLDL